MDEKQIYSAFKEAVDGDKWTYAQIEEATEVPQNSLAQYKSKKSLGKAYKAKLVEWLVRNGYLSVDDDPIKDTINVLLQALELAQNPGKSRAKRCAIILELLSFVETHFAPELRNIALGNKGGGPRE